jgi:hypothetical protein
MFLSCQERLFYLFKNGFTFTDIFDEGSRGIKIFWRQSAGKVSRYKTHPGIGGGTPKAINRD